MSDYENHKGTIKMISSNDETLEDTATKIVINKYTESNEDIEKIKTYINDYYDNSYLEYLLDEFYDDYILYENDLWEVVKDKEYNIENRYIDMKKISNDEFNYDTQFWNDGTSLSDMISIGLEKYNKEHKHD